MGQFHVSSVVATKYIKLHTEMLVEYSRSEVTRELVDIDVVFTRSHSVSVVEKPA